MASACVNNIGMSPENFMDCPATYPSFGWLSPRVSFSRELSEEEAKGAEGKASSPPENLLDQPKVPDPEVSGKDVGDFEFRLEDPVAMLPADELFSDGKLVPLQLSAARPAAACLASREIRSPETTKFRRRAEVSVTDPYLFSPRAPRCSSRWKELLGLRKLYNQSNPKHENQKSLSSPSPLPSNNTISAKSLRNFLQRHSKSSSSPSDASLSLPLLRDSDCESVSISSRLSLSSSSSGHEHEDLPRLSLDSEKPNLNQNPNPSTLVKSSNPNPNPPRVRVVKHRSSSSDNLRPLIDHQANVSRIGRSPMRRVPESGADVSRGVSVDSPRMNSSGKIVFQSLERSSSSPSSFNGGPRFKHRGMERSYSANVRITPVLNVPVCSLRGSSKSGGVFGFGQLFSSPQKRDGARRHRGRGQQPKAVESQQEAHGSDFKAPIHR